MKIGILTLGLHLAGNHSLKDKRRRLKPLMAKLHNHFNVSVAEIGQQDTWQHAVIACVLVSNDGKHVQKSLNHIATWLESKWPDIDIEHDSIEMID